MVKRTKEEAAATREQLLDAAATVFRSRGVGHASLAEVADAAGVTRGAIYHHFSCKADLFQALVDRADMPMDVALAQMDQLAVEEPLAAVRALALMALSRLATCAHTRTVFEVVFLRCEYTDELAPVEQRHLRERTECIDRCQAAFDRAVTLGQLPTGTDTRLASQGLYAFVGGIMRDWVQAGSYDLQVAGGPLIDLYLAGLRTKPPRRADAPNDETLPHAA